MIHKYDTGWISQDSAIANFNRNRANIEAMHNSKIEVIKMTRQPFFLPVCWKVEYRLAGEEK